ncbi:F510_1955 family glycosylhydrolase [Rhodococcus erythropolis]|uniref:F510_1955 family glycosylhydrolase n=1 Tax=Rhodococcus erythropolis TaxID=1833 RepID=UPI0022B517FB|nr:exo-alpha-sialidase [Rhodococcus erythropolis]MCZ4569882.1 exo-alpha-sialidase [Rhodococcus erythropolis]
MPNSRRARTSPIVRLVGAALIAVSLAACSTQGNDDKAGQSIVPPIPGVELTPELDHLHGLHIDADGTILAGTHRGLFAIGDSGDTVRVGDSEDDLMGLAGVTGSDTLFSSGHPGPSSTAANPLGLRTSNDGGRTWTESSLAGQVDFHSLVTDGKSLVGFDGASGVTVSKDQGRSWESGAALGVASLALTDSGTWAVTSSGLQYSSDDGRTFTEVAGAPSMVMIAGYSDALWGVDQDGFAWRSRDGKDWEKRAKVGAVEALTAASYDSAYAATSQSLYALN